MFRIGHGYDVHAFQQNGVLILGGVTVPFDRGVLAHSDGDVLLHAICDALLGAAALGDIGQHFPPSDPRYKDMRSLMFLEKIAALLKEQQWTVSNIDATVVADAPKLASFIPAMRENIAKTLSLQINQVSVKATTQEGLGFIGQGEGIAAHAVTLLSSLKT